MASGLPVGKSVSNVTIDPSNAPDRTKQLMSPNAKEDPDTVTGDNPQQAWLGSGSKPAPPFGPRGRMF